MFTGTGPTNFHIRHLRELLGIAGNSTRLNVEDLPFSTNDITAGTENELQTAVVGDSYAVDLAITIRESNYYKNIIKHTLAGDTSKKVIHKLEDLLNNNTDRVWENSWVRFPRNRISRFANKVLSHDLLKNKNITNSPVRGDLEKFVFHKGGEEHLRIPVSYLLKLALADIISSSLIIDKDMRKLGEQLLVCYLNDNTSPEIISFSPVTAHNSNNIGTALARETLKRYLLTQCLTLYANEKFLLKETGQRTIVYFAPNTPTRQKQLNNYITDSFYRELFMSPCLSGWDRGEEKFAYMNLCHEVMSRSQLNCIAKLKECGILISNLAFLPNISNTSLANNGTHITFGSNKISSALYHNNSMFTQSDEKYIGDLIIKITEHFLPLFVNSYTAAPHRIDYWDFHPEYVLGFLPHELDYTHLRMIWRRWKQRAKQRIFGNPMQPVGLEWFDRIISKIFRLKGDFIYDFRIIDYLMSVLSTTESPALDGSSGNDVKLKKDLSALGVFDERMSLYLLHKLREYSKYGFSGYEARYYSLFPEIFNDMSDATNLQNIITLFAYKLVLSGDINHETIPNSPYCESERRQIFFNSAIGLPTFYIHKKTKNDLLKKIIQKTKKTRPSNRYQGYYRVLLREYKNALISILQEEGSDIIEQQQAKPILQKLNNSINKPDTFSAGARITRSILDKAGVSSPFKLNGSEFNTAADSYYRNELRISHIQEAYRQLLIDINSLYTDQQENDYFIQKFNKLFTKNSAVEFLHKIKEDFINESVSTKNLYKLVQIILISIDHDIKKNDSTFNKNHRDVYNEASVY